MREVNKPFLDKVVLDDVQCQKTMTGRQQERLAPLLEAFYRLPKRHRIHEDPVAIPRRYRDPLEIEVVGWLTVSFAYGRAPLFNETIEKVLSLAGESFYRYLLAFDLKKESPRFNGIYYRFNRSKDILCLVYLMSRVVQQYGAIKPLFLSCYRESDLEIGPTLSRFVAKIKAIDTRSIYKTAKKPSGLLQFFPSPSDGSACKRLNLYLRWMIRPDDGIDFGLWKEIPPSKLMVPLDTHMVRIGRYLGLTSRKTADFKTAMEITKNLRRFDPVDPVKYDFPLCHHGISGNCPIKPNAEKCRICPLSPACERGVALLKNCGILIKSGTK